MTDYSELKRLAEASMGEWYEIGELRCEDRSGYINGLHHDDEYFIAAANPAAVLALIAELEQARLAGSLAYNSDGYKAVLDERDQLKAVNFDYQLGSEAAQEEIARLKAEVVRLRSDNGAWRLTVEAERQIKRVISEEMERLKGPDFAAEIEALRKDAERYRWLRDQEALEGAIAILPVGVWVKPAMLCCIPFDSGQTTDSVVDAAMSKEAGQ